MQTTLVELSPPKKSLKREASEEQGNFKESPASTYSIEHWNKLKDTVRLSEKWFLQLLNNSYPAVKFWKMAKEELVYSTRYDANRKQLKLHPLSINSYPAVKFWKMAKTTGASSLKSPIPHLPLTFSS